MYTQEKDGWIKLEVGFKIRPRDGRIIVLLDKFKQGGRIIIPDKYQVPPTTGVVLGFGSGIENLLVGERVVFGVYSGTLLKFKGQPYIRILGLDEILSSVNEDRELEESGAELMTGYLKDDFDEPFLEGDMIVYEGQVYQVAAIQRPNITDPTIKTPQVPIAAVRLIRDITVAFSTQGRCKNVYKLAKETPLSKANKEPKPS